MYFLVYFGVFVVFACAEQENKEAREVLAGGLGMPEGMKALKEQVCIFVFAVPHTNIPAGFGAGEGWTEFNCSDRGAPAVGGSRSAYRGDTARLYVIAAAKRNGHASVAFFDVKTGVPATDAPVNVLRTRQGRQDAAVT